jgi:phage terminase large subunit-like protein
MPYPYDDIDIREPDREHLALMIEAEKRVRGRNQLQLRREYEESLIQFMIGAWSHMGEAGECIINWHHVEIADAFKRLVEEGTGGNLVVNVPPRCTKSLLLLCFQAWVWAQPSDRWNRLRGPHVRFMCVSYSARLAERFAVQARRLITSDWYQALWGHQVVIPSGQGSRHLFTNTAGGDRFSASIEGGILGAGADCQLVDDPQNYGAAESNIRREGTIDAMRLLVNRVTDPRHTARILVMQRLHQQDATNYAIENWSRKTKFIMFPMRFDIRRADPRDHRENDGELLWPELWTDELVKQQESELLEYGTAGMLQQSPIPRGGGIIKRDWWKTWPDDAEAEGLADLRMAYHCPMCKWADYVEGNWSSYPCPQCGSEAQRFCPFPPISYRLISVDTNYGEGESNSYSAATAWGIWHDKHGAPRVMLTDAWRGRPRLRGDPNATDPNHKLGLVEIIYGMAKRRHTDLILIEKKTRGTDLYNELERITREWPYQLMFTDPTHKGSKTLRLEACVNMFVNGLVWAPNLAYAEEVVKEVCEAPYSSFDDLMDTATAALRHVRDHGLLLTGTEHRRDEVQRTMFRGRSFDANEVFGLV